MPGLALLKLPELRPHEPLPHDRLVRSLTLLGLLSLPLLSALLRQILLPPLRPLIAVQSVARLPDMAAGLKRFLERVLGLFGAGTRLAC